MLICTNPLKRFFAFSYDGLVNLAIWMFVSLILVILNHGQAIDRNYFPQYPLFLLSLTFLYYTCFWTYYQQTVGMRAWRIKITDANGKNIVFIAAIKRFFIGLICILCLGLPIWFAFLNKNRLSLMEYGSQTFIVAVD